ncbi:hypothetical protein WJX75_001534 [Coccomyxa subellipsoidea]|uniref:Amino acid transporter n=1 Tax=Coccomyxa subellipsoidea TaxID=248742 RepID=A0ABR2YNS5_9CHLO
MNDGKQTIILAKSWKGGDRRHQDSLKEMGIPKMGLASASDLTRIDSEQPSASVDSGQARLEALGYRQELHRKFTMYGSFATSLVLMANTSGITGFLSIAYTNGGPVSAVWGWVAVSIANIFVALSMSEIVSSYPIAGGPYFWVLELTKNDRRFLLIGWLTGWLNVLGQFAATAAIGALLANHIANMWLLGNGHTFSSVELLLTYALCLVAAGCVSSISTEGVKQFTNIGAVVLLVTNLAVIVILPSVAPVHQSVDFVFGQFNTDDAAAHGLPNAGYLFFLGTLCAQFTFVGYEAPAQFAEETKRADVAVPWGITLSVVANFFLGLSYMLTLLFCIQDPSMVMTGNAQGYPVGQIFYDAFKARFGSGTGGIIMMIVPLVTTFNSSVLSLVTNARMMWSFSRDGGVPLYKVWAAVNRRTRTPTNAVWAMTALAFLLGLPMLYSLAAFQAIGSISSVGLWLSYGIPIVLRACMRDFEKGPFKLGSLQLPANFIAASWVVISAVAFVLPVAYPVNLANFNWTPVTVALVLAGVLLAWFAPGCGARQWYHGKAHTLEDTSVRGANRYAQGNRSYGGCGNDLPRMTLLDLLEDSTTQQASRRSLRHSTSGRSSEGGGASATVEMACNVPSLKF